MKKFIFALLLILVFKYGFTLDHSGTINLSETWYAADNPHLITGDITIQAPGNGIPSVVDLEPGVEVKFDGDYQITIGSTNGNYPGALRALGTNISPILISSNSLTPAAGDWNCIRFYNYADDDSCHFEYTTFEYGGSSQTMLYLQDSAPTFNNCNFRNMNQPAISPHNSASGAWITNCNFEDGNSYPLTCYATQNYKNGSGNTFSGNTIQSIQVYGEEINESRYWNSQPIPYRIVNDDLTLFGSGYNASILTIESGAVLEFDTSLELEIGINVYADRLGGVMAENVTFQGVADSAGAWFGIRMREYTLGDSNRFDNCTIRNGDYGIYAYNNASFHINNCTFTGNSKAASVAANEMFCFEAGNIYTGNVDDRIEVRSDVVSDSQTWITQATPLHVTGHLEIHGYTNVQSILTINSGSILEFEPGVEFRVGKNVYADRLGGVMAENVTFQGVADSAGAWFGVRMREYTYGDSNRFDNCTFKNGSYGVYVENNAVFHIYNCTFTGNSVAASVLGNGMYCFEAGNIYTANVDDRIEIRSDVVSNSQTWTAQSTPLHVTGHLEIHGYSGVVSILTISPGMILETDPGIEIRSGNSTYADRIGGIMADNVTFRGDADSPGTWFGVRMRRFSYADSNRFDTCTFQNAEYGIYADDRSSFLIENCTFTGNSIAASVLGNEMHCFGADNIYTANVDDRIEIRSDVVSDTQTWTVQSTPLHINGNLDIYGFLGISSILTIDPGMILESDPGYYIGIGNNVYGDRFGGILADNVTFRGSSDSTDAWFGIRSRQYVVGDSNRFDNCTFQNGQYGFFAENETIFHISNCTFTGNSMASSVLANEMHCFEEGNYYADNTDNRIELRGDVINDSQTWTTQNTSLFVAGNISIYKAPGTSHLVIQNGCDLEFAAETVLNIGSGVYSDRHGSLTATGVTFTGDVQTPGYWDGIRFRQYADSPNSHLENCVIEYSGNGNHGNIWCENTSPLITECVIRHSSNYGIHTSGASAIPDIYDCSIISNDIGVYCTSNSQPVIGGAEGNSNDISGNTTYGVQNVSSGVIVDATYNWWGDASGPYDPNGTIETPPCDDPANDLNADGLGDIVSDYVDYCVWRETELSDAPGLFDLLTPAQGDTMWTLIVTFDWEPAIDPTPGDTVRYKIEISSSIGYEPENTLTIENLLNTVYRTSTGELEDDTHYWWRITASDTDNNQTNCNQQDWYIDTYVAERPNAFNLLTPANAETVMLTSPLLTWEEAVDPDPGDSVVYTVYLDDNPYLSDPEIMETTETGIYPPFCSPGTTYFWTVKAIDTYDLIRWSPIFSFDVHPDAGPRPPLWVTIATQGDDIRLEWEEVPGADTYNIYHAGEPYSGFDLLQEDITILEYLHTNALIDFTEHYYYVTAEDGDLRYWRNPDGKIIESVYEIDKMELQRLMDRQKVCSSGSRLTR